MSIKELREASGMNLTQFSQFFVVPYRTVQDWDSGRRTCPAYLVELMRYKLEREGMLNK